MPPAPGLTATVRSDLPWAVIKQLFTLMYKEAHGAMLNEDVMREIIAKARRYEVIVHGLPKWHWYRRGEAVLPRRFLTKEAATRMARFVEKSFDEFNIARPHTGMLLRVKVVLVTPHGRRVLLSRDTGSTGEAVLWATQEYEEAGDLIPIAYEKLPVEALDPEYGEIDDEEAEEEEEEDDEEETPSGEEEDEEEDLGSNDTDSEQDNNEIYDDDMPVLDAYDDDAENPNLPKTSPTPQLYVRVSEVIYKSNRYTEDVHPPGSSERRALETEWQALQALHQKLQTTASFKAVKATRRGNEVYGRENYGIVGTTGGKGDVNTSTDTHERYKELFHASVYETAPNDLGSLRRYHATIEEHYLKTTSSGYPDNHPFKCIIYTLGEVCFLRRNLEDIVQQREQWIAGGSDDGGAASAAKRPRLQFSPQFAKELCAAVLAEDPATGQVYLQGAAAQTCKHRHPSEDLPALAHWYANYWTPEGHANGTQCPLCKED